MARRKVIDYLSFALWPVEIAAGKARWGADVYVFVFTLTLPALVAVSGSAQVQQPGSDDPIAFVRTNPAIGDSQTYIINPDGSREHLLRPGAGGIPAGRPTGTRSRSPGSLPTHDDSQTGKLIH